MDAHEHADGHGEGELDGHTDTGFEVGRCRLTLDSIKTGVESVCSFSAAN